MAVSAPFTVTGGIRSTEASAMIMVMDPDDGPLYYVDTDLAAPDDITDPFSTNTFASLSRPDGQASQALAVQDSRLTGDRLTASGWVQAQSTLGVLTPLPATASASASSVYRVRFMVDEPALVTLCATIATAGHEDGETTNADANVGLSRVIDGIAMPYFGYTSEQAGNDAVPRYFNIRLEPGEWEQQIAIRARSQAVMSLYRSTEASCSVFLQHLGRPCSTADVAEPVGVLDLADITGWVEGFVSDTAIANPTFDLTGDRVLDLADIAAFINAFQAGCAAG